MTVEQLTAKVYEKLKDKDFGSEMGRLLAIQVNLTGRIGGVFYIEILDGRLSVMPYEYIDRDAVLFYDNDKLWKVVVWQAGYAGSISCRKSQD